MEGACDTRATGNRFHSTGLILLNEHGMHARNLRLDRLRDLSSICIHNTCVAKTQVVSFIDTHLLSAWL